MESGRNRRRVTRYEEDPEPEEVLPEDPVDPVDPPDDEPLSLSPEDVELDESLVPPLEDEPPLLELSVDDFLA